MKKILTVAVSIALATHYSFAKGGGSSGGSSSSSRSSSSSYKSSSSSSYGSSSSYSSSSSYKSSSETSFSSFKSSDGSNSSNSGVKSSAKADVKTSNLSNLSDKKTKTVESKKVDKDSLKNSKKSKDDNSSDLLTWFILYQIWASGGSHERRSEDYGSSYTPPPSPNTDDKEIRKLYNIYTKVCSDVGFGKEKTYRITKLERMLLMNRKDVVENLKKVENVSDGLFVARVMGNKVKIRCNKAKESDIKKVEKINRR
jgi:hypothetical protein